MKLSWAYHDGQNLPPTKVSWAPRRMALGSKLDTSNWDRSILSMFVRSEDLQAAWRSTQAGASKPRA